MTMLSVKDLKIHFPVRGGWLGHAKDVIKAVDDVSFEVEEGSTVGLVGESGSGKSTVARALLKLIPVTGGSVIYRGQELMNMPEEEFRPLRRDMQMVFQDPIGSLNPRMTVESILGEPMQIHFKEKMREERRAVSAELLSKVGLPEDALQRYPHEFSGGQRQRIGIARALAVKPRFLICDEPVSALDVSVQAQILNLLKDIQAEFDLTLLFIAHDLAVVRHMSDRIVVMHHGKIVEQGDAEQVCESPRHDYTQKLLDAVPVM
ncbi:ABC transporter ATP-binding protein [Prosthecobacter sp.]|uniref:ABC transporter ATP-binding protein n=1 Tax=Prosthecobacter sp. TaxID=1965333 RepID=UPI003783F19A